MLDSENNVLQVAAQSNSEPDQNIFYTMSERHTCATSFLESFNYYIINVHFFCYNSTDNEYEITFDALKLSKSRFVFWSVSRHL